MGWFLADQPVHRVKMEILIKTGIYILIMNFLVIFRMFFYPKTLKVKIINHDLSHDLIQSVFRALKIYNFEKIEDQKALFLSSNFIACLLILSSLSKQLSSGIPFIHRLIINRSRYVQFRGGNQSQLAVKSGKRSSNQETGFGNKGRLNSEGSA